MQRDIEVNSQLSKDGWINLRFWGLRYSENLQICITQIEKKINEVKRKIKH